MWMKPISRVHGKWCYLYRAIDQDGHLVDSMLSERRNMEAAQRFFRQAVAVVGHAPDGSGAKNFTLTRMKNTSRSAC